MARDPLISVRDALREIEFLEAPVQTSNRADFVTDPLRVRAVAYSVQCISEAVRQLPEERLAEYTDVPWRAIKGAGNKLRHEYYRLEEDILWGIASFDIVPLKAALLALLEKKSGIDK